MAKKWAGNYYPKKLSKEQKKKLIELLDNIGSEVPAVNCWEKGKDLQSRLVMVHHWINETSKFLKELHLKAEHDKL